MLKARYITFGSSGAYVVYVLKVADCCFSSKLKSYSVNSSSYRILQVVRWHWFWALITFVGALHGDAPPNVLVPSIGS